MTDTFDAEHSDQLAAECERAEQQRLLIGMVIRHDQQIRNIQDKLADLAKALTGP